MWAWAPMRFAVARHIILKKIKQKKKWWKKKKRNQQGHLRFQARYELLKQAAGVWWWDGEQAHLNSSNSSNHEEIEGEWGETVHLVNGNTIWHRCHFQWFGSGNASRPNDVVLPLSRGRLRENCWGRSSMSAIRWYMALERWSAWYRLPRMMLEK